MSDLQENNIQLLPDDSYNQTLINAVHPADWINPKPADLYDLVVIGAGTAGLVIAAGAAGLDIGVKVALIEQHLMGGDCLNFGCVPSKSIIRSARAIAEIRKTQTLGINLPLDQIKINFSVVMERMRRIRAGISHHDSAQRFQELGVDVFLGKGQFIADHQIAVGEQILNFKKAAIATGTKATIPNILGIETSNYLTNETIFSLTTIPRRLAILGGGPIGCELAQTLQRLGSEITLFHRNSHILNKEDPDAAELIQNIFIRENINLVLNTQVEKIVANNGEKILYFQQDHQEKILTVDEILVATGRTANVQGLNLEKVGVGYDQSGIKVNDYLQTTNPNIYAAGDICLDWKFTHAADAAARIVIKNTLFSPFGFGKAKISDLVMPWVTYTDPEIAHVGASEKRLQAQNIAFQTIKIPLSNVDRAITDSEEEGFVKIIYQQGSDRILGATIVAAHAGEMISEITTAMVGKLGLNTLAKVIHSYPTQADAIKKAADAYRRTLLTPNSKKLLQWLTKFS